MCVLNVLTSSAFARTVAPRGLDGVFAKVFLSGVGYCSDLNSSPVWRHFSNLFPRVSLIGQMYPCSKRSSFPIDGSSLTLTKRRAGELISGTSHFHPRGLSLARWRPSKPATERLLVELTLNRVDRAALVKPEHFIVQVQRIRNSGESLRHPVRPLKIGLQVRVEIQIAVSPFNPSPP